MNIIESFTRSDGTVIALAEPYLCPGDGWGNLTVVRKTGNIFLVGTVPAQYYECKRLPSASDLNPKTIQQIAVNFRSELGSVYTIGGVRFTMSQPYVLNKENG